MKELAAALKQPAGLRMRQGVVTATCGATCSVLIGGSDTPVDGVQHLNSCAPAVDDVVWIASDGADLWIIGTHGDPPPIDPSRLPAFAGYFSDADPAGAPAPPTGLAGTATPAGVQLRWDLPSEALWRTWEVFEGAAPGFAPAAPAATADATAFTMPNAAGSGPWYYQVRAVNTRGECSSTVEVGPFAIPAVELADGSVLAAKLADGAVDLESAKVSGQVREALLADNAVTQAKIGAGAVGAAQIDVPAVQGAVVTAAAVNALAIDAGSVTAGTLDVARIGAGAIVAAKLDVADVAAAVVTADRVNALAIDAGAITVGTLDTGRLDASEIQAAVVTAAAVNALALNAGAISAGYLSVDRLEAGKISAAKLNVADVQAAVVTAARINALTLNAVTITGGAITGVTVTGATLQTATSGARVKISTDLVSRVQLFSGVAGEMLPGLLGGAGDGSGGSFVELASADFGGGSALLHLGANPSSGTSASITANSSALLVGSASYTVAVDAHLEVAGRIVPTSDFASGTSLDGVWIQDKNNGARCKLYYDSSNSRLYVRRDGSTYSYFGRSGGSSGF